MFFAFACFSLAGTWTQARESTVSVQLTVPDGGWKIRIDRVYQTPTHLLAVSKLERSQGLAIQVISQAKDSVKVKAPKLPVRHFVLGKTWNWPNQEPILFFPTRRNFPNPSPGQNSFFKPKPSLRRKLRTKSITSWYTKKRFSPMEKTKGERIFTSRRTIILNHGSTMEKPSSYWTGLKHGKIFEHFRGVNPSEAPGTESNGH